MPPSFASFGSTPSDSKFTSTVLFINSRNSVNWLGTSAPNDAVPYRLIRYFEKSPQLSNCPRVIRLIIAEEGNSIGGSSGNGTCDRSTSSSTAR